MDYQVWTKEEYADTYTKVDCGDMTAARREIDLAVRLGREPLLTVAVPYELNIKIGEVGDEAKKGKAKPDKVAGSESDRQVRRGDEADTKGLDKGSGDSSAGNSAGD